MSTGKNNKASNKGNRQIIHSVATVEYLRTPMHVRSRAATIKDWLFNICDGRRPNKPIEEFIVEFARFSRELPKSSITGYQFRLYGINRYPNKTHGEDQRIEFKPKLSDMYFIPAKTEYENLDHQQYREKAIIQIKEALSTQKAKASFLTQANYVCLPFCSERISLK